ncbi:MAG: hypothetical protein ACOC1U_04800, partial [Spirochaetota bacterium]
MHILDRSRSIHRERVEAGTILIDSGSQTSALTMIHSGLAELLEPIVDSARTRSDGAPGRRVGLIKGESLCGITNLREPGPARRTVRTVTDCVFSNVPMGPDSIARRLYADISLNMQSLRGLVQRIESAMYLFRNYKYLWHKLASIADSIAIAYDFGPGLMSVDEADRSDASLPTYSAYLRHRLAREKIEPPALWDPNVLVGAVQDRLDLYRDQDAITVESLLDHAQFLFLKRLIAAKGSSLADLLSKDEPATVYMYNFLERALEEMIRANVRLVDEIEELLDRLFGIDGWIPLAFEEQSGTPQEQLFNYYLSTACYRFNKDV